MVLVELERDSLPCAGDVLEIPYDAVLLEDKPGDKEKFEGRTIRVVKIFMDQGSNWNEHKNLPWLDVELTEK